MKWKASESSLRLVVIELVVDKKNVQTAFADVMSETVEGMLARWPFVGEVIAFISASFVNKRNFLQNLWRYNYVVSKSADLFMSDSTGWLSKENWDKLPTLEYKNNFIFASHSRRETFKALARSRQAQKGTQKTFVHREVSGDNKINLFAWAAITFFESVFLLTTDYD